jgi:RNA polymerase sigma factor (sigma-70 family)
MTDISPGSFPEKSALSVLIDECKDQIQQYKRGALSGDSPSCAEIVRRAAYGEQEALTALLEISRPMVEGKCPRNLREMKEDIIQEVNLRLIRKFRNQASSYRHSTFAAYHVYVNMTTKSVILNMQRGEITPASLDQLQEKQPSELTKAQLTKSLPVDRVELREILEKILNQLSDPLEREAIYRRLALEESPEEIAEALQEKSPGIAKEEIYRLVERALRRLKNNPVTQQLRRTMQ